MNKTRVCVLTDFIQGQQVIGHSLSLFMCYVPNCTSEAFYSGTKDMFTLM